MILCGLTYWKGLAWLKECQWLQKKHGRDMWLWTADTRLAWLCWKPTLLAEAGLRQAALKGQFPLLLQQHAPAAEC